MSTTIVIPNYNGKKLFEKILPINMSIFKANYINEILVVDDCSTDDSVNYLEEHYPEIRVIKNKKNSGFSKTANVGIRSAKSDVVFLINSDMIFHHLNLEHITDILKDDTVFGVTPHVFRSDRNNQNEAITVGQFKGGWLQTENAAFKGLDIMIEEKMPILWCCGGALLCLKSKFIELGGFDETFSPFYFEDVDLSYRAWKKGLQCLYTEHCKIEHFHQSSISAAHNQKVIQGIHLRNHYVFMWKNMTDRSYIGSHVLTLLIRFLTCQFKHIKAVIRALMKLPHIIRFRCSFTPKRKDAEVLSKFKL